MTQSVSAPLLLDRAGAPCDAALATAHPAAAGTAYRPAIDGLRAIAVTSVLLFHADIAAAPGGFVGVDIFFVISGYLIMTTLAADIRARRFSVLAFYERRVRRIFPALFVASAFATLAAGLLFPPADFARFGQTLVAMALFSSNLLFCADAVPAGYFADTSANQVLLHTWSLAVEEQFYIFLPIGLALLRRRPERTTVWWLAAITAASLALSVWMVRAWPTGAFYLVLPRAWELLIGSLLALGIAPRISGLWREIEAAAGLALVLAPILLYGRDTPFPGAAALPPCLGAWLIIHATNAGPTLVGRLLATRPFVGVGLISYSLYLWHWPIVVFVKALNMGKLNAQTTIAIVVSSFVAGALSWRFVERPFRGRRAWLRRRGVLGGGALAGGLAIATGLVVAATAGLPQRFDARTLALVRANVARETDNPDGSCENFRKDVRAASDITLCPIGADRPRKILFWGDSLVGGLQPLVARLDREGALGGRGAIFTVSAGCTPSLSLNQNKAGYYCDAFSRAAFERAQAADVDTVFIGFSTWWATVDGGLCEVGPNGCTPLDRQATQARVLAELRTIATRLRARGKSVVLSLPSPIYTLSIPQMQIDEAMLGRSYNGLRKVGLARKLGRNDYGDIRASIGDIAAAIGAEVFDPLASLCDGARCIYQRGGVSIYSDTIHVAVGETGVFHDGLAATLQAKSTRP